MPKFVRNNQCGYGGLLIVWAVRQSDSLCGINVETSDSCCVTQCTRKMGGRPRVGGQMRGIESVADAAAASVSILDKICAQKLFRLLKVLPFASW